MSTRNIKLPAIPVLDNETYKYYYILDQEFGYLLYLFENKPTPHDDGWAIPFTDEDGNYIPCLEYGCSNGQEDWGEPTSLTEHVILYEQFGDHLLYHNFTIDLEYAVFEENPMPDYVEPEPKEPDFPELPNEGLITYKHYCVTDDKENENMYHLYLFKNEPAELKSGIYGLIEVTDKFGNEVECHHYTYLAGMNAWSPENDYSHAFPLRSELSNPFTFHNFDITFEQSVYAKKPLPGDETIIPDLADFLPAIPNPDPCKYKRYFITKRDYDEQFTLYLFEYEPSMVVDRWGNITTSLKDNDKVPS